MRRALAQNALERRSRFLGQLIYTWRKTTSVWKFKRKELWKLRLLVRRKRTAGAFHSWKRLLLNAQVSRLGTELGSSSRSLKLPLHVMRNVMQHGGEKAAELLQGTPEPVARRVRGHANVSLVYPLYKSARSCTTAW